jgi:hypothetical protein
VRQKQNKSDLTSTEKTFRSRKTLDSFSNGRCHGSEESLLVGIGQCAKEIVVANAGGNIPVNVLEVGHDSIWSLIDASETTRFDVQVGTFSLKVWSDAHKFKRELKLTPPKTVATSAELRATFWFSQPHALHITFSHRNQSIKNSN